MTIDRAVASALAQDHCIDGIEIVIVIVDDSLTDATPVVLAQLADALPRGMRSGW